MSCAATACLPRATPIVRRTALRSRPSPLAWLALYRQRRALAALDAHLLDDIGVTARQADRESARPVWDVPRGWRSGT